VAAKWRINTAAKISANENCLSNNENGGGGAERKRRSISEKKTAGSMANNIEAAKTNEKRFNVG
jgi:hypothetical protein